MTEIIVHSVEMKDPSIVLPLDLQMDCERAHIAACERIKKKSAAE